MARDLSSSGIPAFGRDDLRGDRPMAPEQAACLKSLAEQAFEPDAFHPHLSEGEAARRIDALRAKLRLQDGPPHTL